MNEIGIVEQLRIIAEQANAEYQAVLMWVCVFALSAIAVSCLVWQLARFGSRISKMVRFIGPIGCALVLPGAVVLYVYGSTKPSPVATPEITWDGGLSNNGSSFDTNTWATVHFRWNKDFTIPNEADVYFAARHKDYPELEYDEIGSSTASLRAWDYTFPVGVCATNYQFYVFTIGEVHTNGTWVGNVLQKVLNCTGVDKMVIIRGKLDVNGKVIAPFKE